MHVTVHCEVFSAQSPYCLTCAVHFQTTAAEGDEAAARRAEELTLDQYHYTVDAVHACHSASCDHHNTASLSIYSGTCALLCVVHAVAAEGDEAVTRSP
jgi:hypothetical protein